MEEEFIRMPVVGGDIYIRSSAIVSVKRNEKDITIFFKGIPDNTITLNTEDDAKWYQRNVMSLLVRKERKFKRVMNKIK